MSRKPALIKKTLAGTAIAGGLAFASFQAVAGSGAVAPIANFIDEGTTASIASAPPTLPVTKKAAVSTNAYPPGPDTEDFGFVTGAVKDKKPEIYSYTSTVNDDGSIVVRLANPSRFAGPDERDVMAVYAPDVRKVETLLNSQDWYMSVGPNGEMRGVYTVPRGYALGSNVIRSLGEGHGIIKVNPSSSFMKVFPSPQQLSAQLTSFSETARKTFCAMENKPATVKASVDVLPGWSGSGNIKFDATWETKKLCKLSLSGAAGK